MSDIAIKLLVYLNSKEAACLTILNNMLSKKEISEVNKVLNTTKRAQELINIYINSTNNISEEMDIELLDKLIFICKDNINHLLQCSSIVREQNFSNVSFWDHIPVCVNITADFKFMNECVLTFAKEFTKNKKGKEYENKVTLLEDILML